MKEPSSVYCNGVSSGGDGDAYNIIIYIRVVMHVKFNLEQCNVRINLGVRNPES